jgi:hypothetical protein
LYSTDADTDTVQEKTVLAIEPQPIELAMNSMKKALQQESD